MTAEELAHLIERTGRADTFNAWQRYGFAAQLCEMAGLKNEYENSVVEGDGDEEDIIAEAAKKLNVYSIIYGEEEEP